jgi:4-amino-4-deoxy-L-arabinose transferase-like glycosyltransferase
MIPARLFRGLTELADRLVAALTDPARRERTAVVVLLVYVAVWTLYAVLAKASQDVHFDMAEISAWARELALGYPKHPPIAAWLVRAWFTLLPQADWSYHLLAVTVAGAGLWLAWRLAADYLDPEKRVAALALLTLVPFYNFHALKFNVNTVLIPLWAATTLCFLRSYERRSALWGALAGLAAAGAMLGKYWSIVLLAGLGLAALIDPRRRAYFRSAAPWVTGVVGAAVLAPHLVWLYLNDVPPLDYTRTRLSSPGVSAVALSAAEYLGGSFAYVALPMVVAWLMTRPSHAAMRDSYLPATPERRLVVIVLWLTLLLPVAAAIAFRFEITSLWTMSAWTLLPIVMLSSPLVRLGRQPLLTLVAIAIVFPVLMTAVAPVIGIAIHRAGILPPQAHFRLLAERVTHEWRLVTGRPLRLVGGSAELAYGVAFYAPDRPSVFPDFDRRAAPWVQPERITRDGIVAVCAATDPACLAAAQAQGLAARRIEVEIARRHLGVTGPAGRYVVEIVPPQ